MDGRTLLTSLLLSLCHFEEFRQTLVALTSFDSDVTSKNETKSCAVPALSFLDIRLDQSTKNQEQCRVSWRRLKRFVGAVASRPREMG